MLDIAKIVKKKINENDSEKASFIEQQFTMSEVMTGNFYQLESVIKKFSLVCIFHGRNRTKSIKTLFINVPDDNIGLAACIIIKNCLYTYHHEEPAEYMCGLSGDINQFTKNKGFLIIREIEQASKTELTNILNVINTKGQNPIDIIVIGKLSSELHNNSLINDKCAIFNYKG